MKNIHWEDSIIFVLNDNKNMLATSKGIHDYISISIQDMFNNKWAAISKSQT